MAKNKSSVKTSPTGQQVKSLIYETVPIEETVDEEQQEASAEIFESLVDERKEHRNRMFSHVMILTYLSLSLLALIVIIQASVHIITEYKNFTVLDNQQLNIFAVSVFGQMIGVIIVIVKSLWNDEQYLKKIKDR